MVPLICMVEKSRSSTASVALGMAVGNAGHMSQQLYQRLPAKQMSYWPANLFGPFSWYYIGRQPRSRGHMRRMAAGGKGVMRLLYGECADPGTSAKIVEGIEGHVLNASLSSLLEVVRDIGSA